MNLLKLFFMVLMCMFGSTVSQELVELNSRNMITIRGPIKHESVSDFMNKVGKIDSNEIYIYISSPGGSVIELKIKKLLIN